MTYRNKEFRLNGVSVGRPYLKQYQKDYCSGTNSPRLNGKLQFRPNGLQRTFLNYSANGGMYSYKLTNQSSATMSHFSCFDTAASIFVGSDTRWRNDITYAAAMKFYGGLNEINVNLSVAFAERQQTINMIAKSARKIANWYRSFKRGRNPFTGSDCNSANAANLWLEYTYGWAPTCSDLYKIINEKGLIVPDIHYKQVYSERRTVPYTRKKTLSMYSGAFNLCYDREYIQKMSVCIAADIAITDPGTVAAHQLGLTDPLLLAWEIVPYSFVVDWFYPLGPWLEMQNSLKGLSLSRKQTTFTNKVTGTFHCYVANVGPTASYAYGEETCSFIERYKERSLSIPSLPLPRLKSPLSVSHAISALSLLRQVFGRS